MKNYSNELHIIIMTCWDCSVHSQITYKYFPSICRHHSKEQNILNVTQREVIC